MSIIKDRAAFVTGGGSGLGAATATLLATLGAKVAVFDRNAELAQQVATAIGGLALTGDVTDEAQVLAAFKSAADKHGPVQICVNCAGIAPAKRIVGRDGVMPLQEFNQVIQVNLIGSFNVARLAAHEMSTANPWRDAERGVIINTASVAAYEGQIGQAAYSASKGGVVAMTLPMARELARFGIRVMTIAPGIMATPMMTAFPQAVQDSLAVQMPFPQRLGTPTEFAELAAHIVENQFLNGSVIRLDGAIRMAEK